MKVCKFCGSNNDDKVLKCTNCGGNEFQNKCEKCGTLFSEGLYCPKCGVKAGQKAKICPKCGAEYYSVACPDCGYSVNSTGNTHESKTVVEHRVVVEEKEAPKKVTVWKVLLWIFLLPVMGTIAIVKSKLDKKWKIGLIAAIWIAVIVIGAGGRDKEVDNTNAPDTYTAAEDDKNNSAKSDTGVVTSTIEKEQNNPESTKGVEESEQDIKDALGSLSSALGSVVTGYGSYEDIYNDYAEKLTAASVTEMEIYKAGAKEHKGEINTLAELSAQGISRLAEIETEGAEKMAEFMMTGGKGDYAEYETWATKLYKIYEEEAGKLTSEYMSDSLNN